MQIMHLYSNFIAARQCSKLERKKARGAGLSSCSPAHGGTTFMMYTGPLHVVITLT